MLVARGGRAFNLWSRKAAALQNIKTSVKLYYFMGKIAMSFKQGQRELLVKMSAQAGKRAIKKVVRFRNNDVPKYLRGLNKFEEASRRAHLVVG